jgi:hypothetical protein
MNLGGFMPRAQRTPKTSQAQADADAARAAYVLKLSNTADVIAGDLRRGLVDRTLEHTQLDHVTAMHEKLTGDLARFNADFARAVKKDDPKQCEAAVTKFSNDSNKHLAEGQRIHAGKYLSAKFKSCCTALFNGIKAIVKAARRLLACLFSPITYLFKAKSTKPKPKPISGKIEPYSLRRSTSKL